LAGQISHILPVVANSVLATGGRRGGVPKTARCIREAGAAAANGAVLNISVAGWNATFTGGVLATKSERKMLASTCLYSLYAWFVYRFVC